MNTESQHIEFKQKWNDEYLKWICAFANTDGGTLYIGVKDNGDICGLPNIHQLSEDIPNKILHSMGLICDVKSHSRDGKDYLEISVEKYLNPVSYHGKYYKRSGSTTQEVTGYELDKMILAVQGRTWDSVPVTHVGPEDLDELAFQIFKQKALQRHRLSNEDLTVSRRDLLQNLHCFENEYLTRAAILSFHPDPEKWFTCAYIKIAYFQNEADILYQDEVHGSLLYQVERAMEIIYTKYMKALISYKGLNRSETYFFPPDAFRELLLNAVIHKDYMKPTPIQIQVFRDKINIWNYGAMPSDLPPEDLYKQHRSIPRNPNVANIFFRCGYVESWGRGYSKISDICKQWNANMPIPEINTGGLAVDCKASKEYIQLAKNLNIDNFTINQNNSGLIVVATEDPVKYGSEDSQTNSTINQDKVKLIDKLIVKAQIIGIKLTEKRIAMLRMIEANPKITKAEMAKQIGISENAVSKNIEVMRGKFLTRIGADRYGYWQIIKPNS